jgi:hypothetical protein
MTPNTSIAVPPAFRRGSFWLLIGILAFCAAITFRSFIPPLFAPLWVAINSLWKYCNHISERFQNFRLLGSFFSVAGVLLGFRLRYRWQTLKRNRRRKARTATFREIRPLIENGAKVYSRGLSSTSGDGISTFHLQVGTGNHGTDQIFAIQIDTKNGPGLLRGEYPFVEYRHDCVVLWLQTKHGLVDRTYSLH